jgi:hypothetical protein
MKILRSGQTIVDVPVWDPVSPQQRSSLVDAGHRIGPAEATIELVVFVDYDCSSCRQLELALKEMRAEFPEDFAVIYRHYPLRNHQPQAYEKARLAECAANQGLFLKAHDYLIQFAGLGDVDPAYFSHEVGLQGPEFLRCASDSTPVPAIERDLELIHEIRTGRAPSLFLEGEFLTRTATSSSLRSLIESRLNRKGRERLPRDLPPAEAGG